MALVVDDAGRTGRDAGNQLLFASASLATVAVVAYWIAVASFLAAASRGFAGNLFDNLGQIIAIGMASSSASLFLLGAAVCLLIWHHMRLPSDASRFDRVAASLWPVPFLNALLPPIALLRRYDLLPPQRRQALATAAGFWAAWQLLVAVRVVLGIMFHNSPWRVILNGMPQFYWSGEPALSIVFNILPPLLATLAVASLWVAAVRPLRPVQLPPGEAAAPLE